MIPVTVPCKLIIILDTLNICRAIRGKLEAARTMRETGHLTTYHEAALEMLRVSRMIVINIVEEELLALHSQSLLPLNSLPPDQFRTIVKARLSSDALQLKHS